jgi:hypothetical protein
MIFDQWIGFPPVDQQLGYHTLKIVSCFTGQIDATVQRIDQGVEAQCTGPVFKISSPDVSTAFLIKAFEA